MMSRTRPSGERATFNPIFSFRTDRVNAGALPGIAGMKMRTRTRQDHGDSMVNVSKEGQVFKCEICGNVVVVKEAGGGELICCGEPMVLEE